MSLVASFIKLQWSHYYNKYNKYYYTAIDLSQKNKKKVEQ